MLCSTSALCREAISSQLVSSSESVSVLYAERSDASSELASSSAVLARYCRCGSQLMMVSIPGSHARQAIGMPLSAYKSGSRSGSRFDISLDFQDRAGFSRSRASPSSSSSRKPMWPVHVHNRKSKRRYVSTASTHGRTSYLHCTCSLLSQTSQNVPRFCEHMEHAKRPELSVQEG